MDGIHKIKEDGIEFYYCEYCSAIAWDSPENIIHKEYCLFYNRGGDKMEKEKEQKNIFTGLLSILLFVLFLGLKLGHVIDWNWWWVFAPLWMPFAIFFGIVSIIIVILAIAHIIKRIVKKYD